MGKSVFISVDIEGITGLVSWSQCSRPDGSSFDYPFARRMMTRDTNAAIRGAMQAGADRIVVKDSHGNSKNLLIDELEEGVELISGNGHPDRMMGGFDATFSCALLVGYHAMAGTEHGVMEHTYTGRSHRLFHNQIEVGEIALAALTAGRYGRGLALVTSDDAGCAEARKLVPEIETYSVKQGFGRYAARLLHPSVTGPSIEAAAKRAVSATLPDPFKQQQPVTVRLEVNRTEDADFAAKLPGVSRINGFAVERITNSAQETHEWSHLLLEVGALGLASHD